MSSYYDYDYRVKFSLVGDTGVGKSCLTSRFTENKCSMEHQVTIGVDYGSKLLSYLDNGIPRNVKIQIWDTAGQETFRAICKSYYRNIDAVMIVFDLTKLPSFQNLDYWINDIRVSNPEAIITIIGNKQDQVKKRKVSFEKAHRFAVNRNLPYFETSAKLGNGIEEAFLNTFLYCQKMNPECIVENNQEPVIDLAENKYKWIKNKINSVKVKTDRCCIIS